MSSSSSSDEQPRGRSEERQPVQGQPPLMGSAPWTNPVTMRANLSAPTTPFLHDFSGETIPLPGLRPEDLTTSSTSESSRARSATTALETQAPEDVPAQLLGLLQNEEPRVIKATLTAWTNSLIDDAFGGQYLSTVESEPLKKINQIIECIATVTINDDDGPLSHQVWLANLGRDIWRRYGHKLRAWLKHHVGNQHAMRFIMEGLSQGYPDDGVSDEASHSGEVSQSGVEQGVNPVDYLPVPSEGSSEAVEEQDKSDDAATASPV